MFLGNTVAYNNFDVGAAVVLEWTDIVAPVLLDCAADIALGAPVYCTLADTTVAFGCTVVPYCCGAGMAFAVACWFGRCPL